MRHRAVSAALVVLMHSTLLWSCAAATQPPVHPPAPPRPVILLPADDTKLTALEGGDALCADSYVGVGIRHFGNAIFEVAPGSPAERAGLLVGDEMLNPEVLGRDRYPVGHEVWLRVERGGTKLMVIMRTARICEAA